MCRIFVIKHTHLENGKMARTSGLSTSSWAQWFKWQKTCLNSRGISLKTRPKKLKRLNYGHLNQANPFNVTPCFCCMNVRILKAKWGMTSFFSIQNPLKTSQISKLIKLAFFKDCMVSWASPKPTFYNFYNSN